MGLKQPLEKKKVESENLNKKVTDRLNKIKMNLFYLGWKIILQK